MINKKERDEYLENLWYLKESDKDSLDELIASMGSEYDRKVINELFSDGLINFNEIEKKVSLSESGLEYARQLIRAHRIAERMLYDVLSVKDFEAGACEFEHTITPELVDGICILLGHPKFCPHGLPIPEGECCRKSLKTAQSSVVPLSEIKQGHTVRVAYVTNRDEQELHRIDGLHIRPGSILSIQQVYPAFVIECEGVNIALDNDVASNIFVWQDPGRSFDKENFLGKDQKKGCSTGRKRRKGFMQKLRKGMML